MLEGKEAFALAQLYHAGYKSCGNCHHFKSCQEIKWITCNDWYPDYPALRELRKEVESNLDYYAAELKKVNERIEIFKGTAVYEYYKQSRQAAVDQLVEKAKKTIDALNLIDRA